MANLLLTSTTLVSLFVLTSTSVVHAQESSSDVICSRYLAALETIQKIQSADSDTWQRWRPAVFLGGGVATGAASVVGLNRIVDAEFVAHYTVRTAIDPEKLAENLLDRGFDRSAARAIAGADAEAVRITGRKAAQLTAARKAIGVLFLTGVASSVFGILDFFFWSGPEKLGDGSETGQYIEDVMKLLAMDRSLACYYIRSNTRLQMAIVTHADRYPEAMMALLGITQGEGYFESLLDPSIFDGTEKRIRSEEMQPRRPDALSAAAKQGS